MTGDTRWVPVAGQSIDDVFEKLYPSLRQFAAAVADSDVEPDDLVQEALVGFLQAGGDVANLRAYVYTSIVHAAGRERSRLARQRETRQQQTASYGNAATHYPSHIAALLDGVPPIDRALLYLIHVEGAPVNEAAAAVGLSHTAARARVSRARRSLRRQLKERIND